MFPTASTTLASTQAMNEECDREAERLQKAKPSSSEISVEEAGGDLWDPG